MAPKGRKRKARALTDVDVSASSASQRRAVEAHGAPAAAVGDANDQQKGEEEFGKSWTPYGTLMKKLPLDIIDSARTVMLEYICPFAFLWLASQESTGFASFLALYFGALGVGEAAPATSVLDESRPPALAYTWTTRGLATTCGQTRAVSIMPTIGLSLNCLIGSERRRSDGSRSALCWWNR